MRVCFGVAGRRAPPARPPSKLDGAMANISLLHAPCKNRHALDGLPEPGLGRGRRRVTFVVLCAVRIIVTGARWRRRDAAAVWVERRAGGVGDSGLAGVAGQHHGVGRTRALLLPPTHKAREV